jgi:hypothetical protein
MNESNEVHQDLSISNASISGQVGQAGRDLIQFGHIEHLEIGTDRKMNNGMLKVEIGSLTGSVVNIASSDLYLPPMPRSTPVRLAPRAFPLLIGRREAVKQVLDVLPYEQSVEFYGAAGIGKTAVLRYLSHHPTIVPAFADGMIYYRLSHRQTVADVFQILFDAFYECKTPFQATHLQIRQALTGKKALVILDGLNWPREAIDQLVNELPDLTFWFAGLDRHLWGEGKSIGLRGLAVNEVIAVIAQALGYELNLTDRVAAETIGTALDGHPLRILQAIALAQTEQQSLATIAQQVKAATASSSWAEYLTARLPQPQRVIIALLMALGANVALGAEVVVGITNLPDGKAVLEMLLRRNLVEIEGDRVRLSSNLLEGLPQHTDLTSWMERSISFLTQWVQQHQGSPTVILQESDVILRSLEVATAAGRWSDVLILGHSIAGGLALGGQWGTWETVLQSMLEAARATGDQTMEAFVLHELGTRLIGLNQVPEAQTYLSQALEIRQGLGDPAAIAATKQNLHFLSGGWLVDWSWLVGGFVGLLLAISLIVLRSTWPSPQPPPSPVPPPTPASIAPSTIPSPTVIMLDPAQPANIKPGESSTLCYEVTNASSAQLNNGQSLNLQDSCITVSPTETTTYSITATGNDGQQQTSNEVQVTVTTPPPPPPLPAPTAVLEKPQPTEIKSGESSKLCYKVTNASSAKLNNDQSLDLKESCVTVSPAETTTYVITATSSDGQQQTSNEVQMTVITPPPPLPAPIAVLKEPLPAKIYRGESSKLCYEVTNASTAKLNNDQLLDLKESCITVSPVDTMTYSITVTGSDGQQQTSKEVQVTVIFVE